MAKEQIGRILRDVQSHIPMIRPAKFACYNFMSWRLGLHVEPEFRLLSRLGEVGQAIDIGGNWGQSVYALKRHADPKRIVSFEPNPTLAANLGRIASQLGDVEVRTMALGEAAGTFDLFVPRYRGYVYDGLASLDENSARDWLNPQRVWRFDPNLLVIERHSVEVRTLDSFGFAPDIVKIDVQGTEEAVVRGGAQTFERYKPVTIVEAPSPELVALFATLGMDRYGLDGDRIVPGDTGGVNALFLADFRLAELNDRRP